MPVDDSSINERDAHDPRGPSLGAQPERGDPGASGNTEETARFVRLRDALAARYAIENEVGRGGWSIVYRARDLKHDRLVAIKVLRPEIAATVGVDRFLREIEVAAKLQHPHILPVYDSGEADGLLYYVMPFVEGDSLRERLEHEHRIPVDEALAIAREVGSALGYAHDRGVVHRDIKPANILLSGGHAVIADFGIARALGASSGPALTQAGMAIGTPEYMSPEQVVGSGDIDGRSDVYSLGCVLFEMLAGAPPFEGPTAQAVMTKRFSDPVPRIAKTVRGSVSPSVERALATALAAEPEHRFASAAEFVRALRASAAPPATLALGIGPLGVAGLYLIGAVFLLAASRFLVVQLGLPDWALVGVGVLVAAGLPLTLAAALTERRAARPEWPGRAWLGWRTLLRAGAMGFGAWALVVAVYMAMRLLGVGPVGTLVASGVLDRGQRIVLADFESRTSDTSLGAAVTEALRVDLAQSDIVTPVDRDYVTRVLARMERPPEARLDEALAREVAIREGIGAVISGEILAVGGGHVLSARIVSAGTGAELAAMRETAADSTALIPAIDRLSKRLRARIGESLRTVRASEPLEQVTTGSLAALQKYSQAQRALRRGDPLRGRALLQEAVALDTGFAMAYRRLGTVALGRAEQVTAFTKAFEHRDRLSDRERYITMGSYYGAVTAERRRAIDAYRSALDLDPHDVTALNNLGTLYLDERDYGQAEQLFLRLVSVDSTNPGAYQNAISAQVSRGALDDARATLNRFEANVPDHPAAAYVAALLTGVEGDYEEAATRFASLEEARRGELVWRLNANAGLASVALVRGKLAEAEARIGALIADAAQLDLPALSLRSELQGATLDLMFRGEVEGPLQRVERAREQFPLDEVEPLDRPYADLASFYAFAKRPDLARAALADLDAALAPQVRRAAEPARRTILGLIALAEDRPRDAVEELRAADDGSCQICLLPLLGLAYDEAGQADSAIAVYERYLTTPWLHRLSLDVSWLGPTYERLGELHAARGDHAQAVEYFGLVAELWQDADPELQPRVEAARHRINELATDRPQR